MTRYDKFRARDAEAAVVFMLLACVAAAIYLCITEKPVGEMRYCFWAMCVTSIIRVVESPLWGWLDVSYSDSEF